MSASDDWGDPPICTRCQGRRFEAKRTKGGVLVSGVRAPKSRLRCTTCGTEWDRDRVPRAPLPPDPTLDHTDPAGWYADPYGRHQLRWWGGVSWTDEVCDGIIRRSDPIPEDDGWAFLDGVFEGFASVFPETPAAPSRTVAEQIRDLAALRDEGLLTEEEFQAQKARILG